MRLNMKKANSKYKLKLLLLLSVVFFSYVASAQGLKANGKKIVDQTGHEVILRGMGLGGWMLQEPYMMEMSGFAVTQWQIKQKISALIGDINKDIFYQAWLANHCTRLDIDSLAAWGFNSVRLPMHYNLFTLPIEEEPVPGQNTWLDKGFALTDSLISWCKANHMYVILDLHAAPGGQGKDAAISDADPSKPTLWESTANKQKTIALWRKLAERYANEPWVGGYDLINEPNWSFTANENQNGCSENGNGPLRQMYVDITAAIRQVDTKHLIIIEGNCWGNNYNGIFPLWDNNMALSFHKYWSTNDQGSIAGIVGLRDTYNVPIWLGESGENSNAWFTDAIRLVEKNGIGWAWWPLKKISSVVDPLTIVKTPDYQTLLNYWNGSGTAPSASFAMNALMKIAENAKIQNCVFHKDVIDAMFRQVYDSTTTAFAKNSIPGVIHATDYDLGRLDKAYYDTQSADYHVSTGTYTEWNTGWLYRNDGVDIGDTHDTDPASNGFYVGWTADNEWMQYTADVDSTAAYSVNIRYASLASGSAIRLFVNDAPVTASVSLPVTGGYQNWANYTLNDLVLYKGKQRIKLMFDKGGANLGYLDFTLQKKTNDISLIPVSAETYKQTELIYLTCNKYLADTTLSSEGFTCLVNANQVSISGVSRNPDNPLEIIINLSQHLSDIDVIKISYSGGKVGSVDGTPLQDFSNLQVKNNLPVYTSIPGKIEAESFSFNQGLVTEQCSDVGGGYDLGYTSTGDYVDYHVRVLKSAKYFMEARIACLSAAGKIEVQQLSSTGVLLHSVQLNIPVTGGWQTWQTVGTNIDLTEGVSTLRVKILQPEFNMNWFNFSETGIGIAENASRAFSFFPNPAQSELSVMVPGSAGHQKSLEISTISGALMKQITMSATDESQRVYVGDLPKGIYLIALREDGNVFYQKLIIQ